MSYEAVARLDHVLGHSVANFGVALTSMWVMREKHLHQFGLKSVMRLVCVLSDTLTLVYMISDDD